MTDMQKTSLEAFERIKDTLGLRQLQVYQALKEIQPATNSMIAKHLNWTINKVTGRINELRNKHKVVGYAYTGICKETKSKCMFWKIVK